MTEWKSVRVGEVAQLINGDRGKNYPAARHRTASGVPFINAGHLDGGRVRLDSMDFIPPERFQLLRSGKVEVDDVLLCIRGSIGRWALVTPDSVPGAIASSLVILRSGPAILPQFLGYHIASPEGSRSIVAGNNGAAQPNVGAQQVASLAMSLPPLDVQRRIVDVLGSIDDLIENNRRRIEVLEEMARAIYREWFVKFRYPGHEGVPLVDSALGPIPEGWQVGELNDLVQLIRDTVDPAAIDAETPAVGLEHIPRKQITLDSWGTAGDQGSRKGVFEKGDVLFGKIRPYFHKVSVAPIDGICSTDAIVLRPASEHWGQAVFVLSSVELVAHATATSNGTKMPRADWKVLGRWPVALPPSAVAGQFTEIARGQLEMAETLMFENARLANLRDLLLPKLVTGEIDVSSLDLDAVVVEQVA